MIRGQVGNPWPRMVVNCEESIYSRPIACRLARTLALYPGMTNYHNEPQRTVNEQNVNKILQSVSRI